MFHVLWCLTAKGVSGAATSHLLFVLHLPLIFRAQPLQGLGGFMEKDHLPSPVSRLVLKGGDGGGGSEIQGLVYQEWPINLFPIQNLICPLRNFLTDPRGGVPPPYLFPIQAQGCL